ncbi:MAG: hypothetical protein K6A40_04890 [Solobacterium sp.]|nr:hypothetical protein [Solobacterium sp.]
MKRILACFWTLLLAFVMCIPVHANSAKYWWYGSDGRGTETLDEDCPLVVDHEDLTFHIASFPKDHYVSREEVRSYDASVTASYTFRNPESFAVDARLVFPFGTPPEYIYEGGSLIPEEKYRITADGKEIPCITRYTYTPDEFSVGTDLARLSDTFISDPFYRPDLPVHILRWRVEELEDKGGLVLYAGMTFKPDRDHTRYLFPEECGIRQDQTETRVDLFAKKGGILEAVVFGTVPSDLPEWGFYDYDNHPVEGKAVRLEDETTDLGTYAKRLVSPDSFAAVMPETEWYNCVIAFLNRWDNHGFIFKDKGDIDSSLMRWYEYSLHLDPGQTVVNSVTAPIYPDQDHSWSSPVYTYTYLLSPASTWKSFGSLDITVETDFEMISKKPAFEKADSVYKLHYDSLPKGELEFKLCAEADPKNNRAATGWLILAMIALPPLLGLILVIWLLKKLFSRKKR